MGTEGGCALSKESLISGLEVRCLSLAESDNETYLISIKYPLITLPRRLQLNYTISIFTESYFEEQELEIVR
jgi:hypothetical protein